MHIALSDVRPDPLKAAVLLLKQEAPGRIVHGYHCDVTNLESVQVLLESVTRDFSGHAIQFVGANAGVLFPKSTVYVTFRAYYYNLSYHIFVVNEGYFLFHFIYVVCSFYGPVVLLPPGVFFHTTSSTMSRVMQMLTLQMQPNYGAGSREHRGSGTRPTRSTSLVCSTLSRPSRLSS